MPEAPVYEDCGVPPLEDHVRSPREATVIHAKPQAATVKHGAHHQFRMRVTRPNFRHDPTARVAIDDVSHCTQAAPSRRTRPRSLRPVTMGTSARAIASTTGTATEFPNCLYAWVSDTTI